MQIDPAELAGNRIEAQTLKRVVEIYNAALQKITDECNAFLRKIKDIDEGRIKPPAYYDTPEKVLAWRRGFTRELLRKENVAKRVEAVLSAAGAETAPIIRESIAAIYKVNREYALEMLGDKARSIGVNVEFSMFDKRQIDVLLKSSQPAFSKIAYRSLGSNPAIVHRLQNELAQATILGEGQSKIIKRIRDVTGQSLYQAKRVAQTERTRVQSQGRAEALHEAANAGVKVTKEWSARMVNTRDSHAALNGKKIKESEKFKTIWGNELAYPGDPSAPAEEVINCHCVMVPGVEMTQGKDEVFRKGTNSGAFSSLPERMSKKHIRAVAKEYGIDMKGLQLVIDRDPDKLKPSFPNTGRADTITVGRIDFFPKAFKSKEELTRTLVHEKIHVGQFLEFGVEAVQNDLMHFEKLAYAEEDRFIERLLKEGLI